MHHAERALILFTDVIGNTVYAKTKHVAQKYTKRISVPQKAYHKRHNLCISDRNDPIGIALFEPLPRKTPISLVKTHCDLAQP